jgi:hypothetical protein
MAVDVRGCRGEQANPESSIPARSAVRIRIGGHHADRIHRECASDGDALLHALGFRRKLSPYFSTTHASRTFIVAMATTARR